MEQIEEPVKIEKIMYKICCRDPAITDIYVGQTENLKARRCRHKFCCNNETDANYNLYVYDFIRNNGGFDNWCVIPIETFVCENKIDVAIRERFWIETLNATLNKVIPSRSKTEYGKIYQITNKNKLQQYRADNYVLNYEKHQQYRLDNHDYIQKKSLEYYTANKNKINEDSRKYRLNNKEKLKQYFIDNKDKINQRRREQRALKKEQDMNLIF